MKSKEQLQNSVNAGSADTDNIGDVEDRWARAVCIKLSLN